MLDRKRISLANKRFVPKVIIQLVLFTKMNALFSYHSNFQYVSYASSQAQS